MFRTFQVEPVAGLSLVPIIPYRSVFAKLSASLRAFGWFRSSVCRPIKTIKKLNALAVLGLAFSFVFDFARSPTDAKPPDDCLAYAARCVVALRCESTNQVILV